MVVMCGGVLSFGKVVKGEKKRLKKMKNYKIDFLFF